MTSWVIITTVMFKLKGSFFCIVNTIVNSDTNTTENIDVDLFVLCTVAGLLIIQSSVLHAVLITILGCSNNALSDSASSIIISLQMLHYENKSLLSYGTSV